jgi:hypothetical protein
MNANEPVAWITKEKNASSTVKPDDEENWIPLYSEITMKWDDKTTYKTTTPQTKPLTRQEVKEIADYCLIQLEDCGKTFDKENHLKQCSSGIWQGNLWDFYMAIEAKVRGEK